MKGRKQMLKKTKKLSALLMAVVMILTAFGIPAVSAADTNDPAPVAASDMELAPAAADPTEPAPAPTEAPTPTEAPVPTEEPAPVIGKVKNVAKTSFENNLITLSWDPVEGATGYKIYQCNMDETTTYSYVGAVKNPTYTAKNLKHTTAYYFKVLAYVNKNGKTYDGPETIKRTATQPGPLTGLAKWRSSTVLRMEWNRNAKATGYMVYRKSAESGNKEVLYKKIYGNKTTYFEDTAVKAGRTYTYRIKSFRELYNTSYSGKSGTETFMAGLCAPDYSIVSRCKRVNLTWKANRYATHYEVYYSTSPDNSKFVKLFTTPRLYYNTTQLPVGKTYYFRVRPIYQKGSTLITGTSNKKSAKILDSAYGKKTGNTYVEISISQQHMWAYKNGTRIATTDVVTGNYGSNDTPKGYFNIFSKARETDLIGADYVSHVSYWMAFYGGCGIHDASWRSSYGGSIYKGNGSHGCVNTPYSQVKKIYENIPYGTPVIIY